MSELGGSPSTAEFVLFSCPSCPVDLRAPGRCDVCERPLVRRVVRSARKVAKRSPAKLWEADDV